MLDITLRSVTSYTWKSIQSSTNFSKYGEGKYIWLLNQEYEIEVWRLDKIGRYKFFFFKIKGNKEEQKKMDK
jgi:hypothetical protein